jgi:hypothetical protein
MTSFIARRIYSKRILPNIFFLVFTLAVLAALIVMAGVIAMMLHGEKTLEIWAAILFAVLMWFFWAIIGLICVISILQSLFGRIEYEVDGDRLIMRGRFLGIPWARREFLYSRMQRPRLEPYRQVAPNNVNQHWIVPPHQLTIHFDYAGQHEWLGLELDNDELRNLYQSLVSQWCPEGPNGETRGG